MEKEFLRKCRMVTDVSLADEPSHEVIVEKEFLRKCRMVTDVSLAEESSHEEESVPDWKC